MKEKEEVFKQNENLYDEGKRKSNFYVYKCCAVSRKHLLGQARRIVNYYTSL